MPSYLFLAAISWWNLNWNEVQVIGLKFVFLRIYAMDLDKSLCNRFLIYLTTYFGSLHILLWSLHGDIWPFSYIRFVCLHFDISALIRVSVYYRKTRKVTYKREHFLKSLGQEEKIIVLRQERHMPLNRSYLRLLL